MDERLLKKKRNFWGPTKSKMCQGHDPIHSIDRVNRTTQINAPVVEDTETHLE